MPVITPITAGFDVAFDGWFVVILLAFWVGGALVFAAPAGLAGALVGRHLARRRLLGWCVGWCVGAISAGAGAWAAAGAGASGPVLAACAYVPAWAVWAALVARRARPVV